MTTTDNDPRQVGLTLADIKAVIGDEVLEQHRLRKELAQRDAQIEALLQELARRDANKDRPPDQG